MKFFELYGNFLEFEMKKSPLIAWSGNTCVIYAYVYWVGSLGEDLKITQLSLDLYLEFNLNKNYNFFCNDFARVQISKCNSHDK